VLLIQRAGYIQGVKETDAPLFYPGGMNIFVAEDTATLKRTHADTAACNSHPSPANGFDRVQEPGK